MRLRLLLCLVIVAVVACGCDATKDLGTGPCPAWATFKKEECAVCRFRQGDVDKEDTEVTLRLGEQASMRVYKGRMVVTEPSNLKVINEQGEEVSISSTILSVGTYYLRSIDSEKTSGFIFLEVDEGAFLEVLLVSCVK